MLTSCVQHADEKTRYDPAFDTSIDRFPVKVDARHARCFAVEYFNYYKKVSILDRSNGDTVLQLCLLLHDAPLPSGYTQQQVVRIPLQSAASISTTHLPFIAALQQLDKLKGFGAFDYLNNDSLRALLQLHAADAVGSGGVVDEEKLLKAAPQVNFTYLFQNDRGASYHKGIHHIPVMEYMETHPLGAAEYIKFFALFFNQERQADSIYRALSERYDNLSTLAAKNQGPSVFVGLPWKDSWSMASGNSYTAQLIADAGGEYVNQHEHELGNLEFTMEEVLAQCLHTDVWLMTSYFDEGGSMQALLESDERLARFDAFRNGQIYACDLSTKDYFGQALLEPDVILRDFIHIFYPSLALKHKPVYFERME